MKGCVNYGKLITRSRYPSHTSFMGKNHDNFAKVHETLEPFMRQGYHDENERVLLTVVGDEVESKLFSVALSSSECVDQPPLATVSLLMGVRMTVVSVSLWPGRGTGVFI